MNILLINSYYYPDMAGGAEHSVKLLAEGLLYAGHRVAVLCVSGRRDPARYTYEKINGVDVYRDIDPLAQKRKGLHKMIARLKVFNNRHCKKLCDRIVEAFCPDVVHTNNLQIISTYVWKYFYKKKIPVVFTARDYWLLDHSCIYEKSNKLINYFYKLYYRHQSNRYVDLVTAPSQLTLDIFRKERYFRGVPSLRVVNCVKLDFKETASAIKEKQERNDKIVRFLFVGTLGAYKGIVNLLEAFRRIEDEDIRLTICGSGAEESRVRQACEADRRIDYLGQLKSEELKKVYLTCDVLIAPSVWDEPFGRIVIEANQYGLPVIGSDRGGIKEILAFTKTGEVFPAEDVGALADRIVDFANRDTIRSYRSRILDTIGEYSFEKQAENYCSVYQRAIEEKRKQLKG